MRRREGIQMQSEIKNTKRERLQSYYQRWKNQRLDWAEKVYKIASKICGVQKKSRDEGSQPRSYF